MNNPEYIQIDDVKYKINTDFRVAIRFQQLVRQKNISDYELILGTIELFYGREGIIHGEHYERLVNGALNFIKGRPSSFKPEKNGKNAKIDMDYIKDWGIIASSIKQEYGIDINKEKIHWWTFFDYLNGLSSECLFNRVREIRNKDISKIKDKKERDEYIKLKEQWKLEEDQVKLTQEQIDSVNKFYELTGIERK